MENILKNENYQYLIMYYKKFGNINVPLEFKVKTKEGQIINDVNPNW